jgi:hypothetical protein
VTIGVTGNVQRVKPPEPVADTVSDDGGDELPDLTIESTPIATARRRYGVAGAIMGAGLLGIEQALGLRKVKEEAPIVVAAATEPVDIDSEGIDMAVDEQTSVYAPPQPRSKPPTKPRTKPAHRR